VVNRPHSVYAGRTPPGSAVGPAREWSKFAQHATGKMTADQAIAWTEKEMQEIYAGRRRER
jgi:hypothetical protein